MTSGEIMCVDTSLLTYMILRDSRLMPASSCAEAVEIMKETIRNKIILFIVDEINCGVILDFCFILSYFFRDSGRNGLVSILKSLHGHSA